MNRYAWFFAMDRPTRTRPLDWSPTIAVLAPAQLMPFALRHSADPRHHVNDPDWTKAVDLTPRIDHELLRLRARYAQAMPGVEVN